VATPILNALTMFSIRLELIVVLPRSSSPTENTHCIELLQEEDNMNYGIRKLSLFQDLIGGQMKRAIYAFAVALAVILLGSVAGAAQGTTSEISGTVTDGTGAVVVGASVKVLNTATGVVYNTTSDNMGSFHVTQLPPGSYTMELARAGFATQNLNAFRLFLDQHLQQNITLAVGQAVQTVSVSAAALLLDTEAANQAQLIQNQQINDMPLNGRDVLQLAQLSAGVTPVISGMSSPASSWTGTQVVSVMIGGLREDDTSYLYDGIETRNAWYGADGLLPSPDNVQEFKVEQSGSSAAFGDGGAFITMVTKSGTNQIHGSAFEFVRNNAMNAKNYFSTVIPPFHQNQFGASFGGPIKKNKMFYFGNYEGFRLISSVDVFNNVPTAAMLKGDFSADTAQLVNPKNLVDPVLGGYKPFPGNQVPSQYWDSVGQQILALFPAPNGSFTGGTTNYHYLASTINNWDQESGRFDYTISSKDNIFVRFTNQQQTQTVTDVTKWRAKVYPSDPKNLAVGWTRVISPSIVNNVRWGWAHTAVGVQRFDGYTQADANPLHLTNEQDQPGSFGYPAFSITNYANPGSTQGTDIVREGMNMWTESLMWQKGRHQLTGGMDLRYQPIYMYEDWKGTSITFNGTETGDPIADLLVGVPSASGTAIGNPELNLRMWYQAYYVQDNFKVNNHLTLNIGGRWEHQQQPIDTANHVGSYDFVHNTDLVYPATNALGLGRNMVKPVFYNWSPRIGFNFSPFTNGNWDIKGGIGLYYLQPNINQYEVEVDTISNYLVENYTQSALGKPINFATSQLFGPSISNTNGAALPTISFMQPNEKTPYTYEWSLSIDRSVRNWLLEATYMGSAAHHTETRVEIDPELPGAVFPLAGWAAVEENGNFGKSNYNGLITRVEHRYSSGFTVLGSYTWSKCLDTPWQDQFTWHPLNLSMDRGHCTWDMSQNMTANTIYELPFGKGKAFMNQGGISDAVLGGWKFAAIAGIRSGPWLTLGSSQSLGTFVNALPTVSGPVNNKSLNGGLGKNGKLGPYFNTQNVTKITTVGVQGNAGVANIYGPGSATWDLSGNKTWTFAERFGLTFRADAFNAFNRVNFAGLSTSSTSSTFGKVTNASPARTIQLSMRLAF
jgi:outer membrane receptor protein involved in Fe transport